MHDFDEDKPYPELYLRLFGTKYASKIPALLLRDATGYFDDDCPISLMHPTIPSDYCLFQHFEEYKKEMLERCDPW
jgi:hypothetical protein